MYVGKMAKMRFWLDLGCCCTSVDLPLRNEGFWHTNWSLLPLFVICVANRIINQQQIEKMMTTNSGSTRSLWLCSIYNPHSFKLCPALISNSVQLCCMAIVFCTDHYTSLLDLIVKSNFGFHFRNSGSGMVKFAVSCNMLFGKIFLPLAAIMFAYC